ncbi:MAG: 1-acyl-sn-glycerol-3-phosphate acyltransferase [Erysipelotrichales bacterium]|nr:1-acyl-sn-glycerol-3-phosphate acyltransferase [Erysipelotrichales bacterium]
MKNFLQGICYFLFKCVMGLYVTIFQHVRFYKNKIKLPRKQPVLFLSNHHTNWDPVYLNVMFFSRNIHFIENEELFENKFFRFIFGICLGNIKRSSNKSDVSDVIDILRLKKEGHNIGIYPEGDIDMFGRIINRNFAISKLSKKLYMPIVLLSLKGAHLRAPRWSKLPHHSKINYNLNRLISLEEIKSMSIEDLDKAIWDGISVDEMETQKENRIRQFGPSRAKWLELGLFLCPKCGKYETMHSKRNVLYCSKCGFKVKLNKYSFFEFTKSKDKPPFVTTAEWNDYQINDLEKRIESVDDNPILEKEGLKLFAANYNDKFDKKDYKDASLSIFKDKIELKIEDFIEIFNVNDIIDCSLIHKDVLEICLPDGRYRFEYDDEKWPAYLYVQCINKIRESRD